MSDVFGFLLKQQAAKVGRLSKTELLRRALADGPKRARELASAAGIGSHAVQPLLKDDIARGRVVCRRDGPFGPQVYELSQAFDKAHQQRITEAKALLARSGYTVLGPSREAP